MEHGHKIRECLLTMRFADFSTSNAFTTGFGGASSYDLASRHQIEIVAFQEVRTPPGAKYLELRLTPRSTEGTGLPPDLLRLTLRIPAE